MANDPANETESPLSCPICGKPSVAAFRPFCSKRCSDVDLQRWLSGRYAIPVVEDDGTVEESSEEDGAGQGPGSSL